MCRESDVRSAVCRCGVLALVLILLGAASAQDTRVDAPIPHAVGQSVSASFEGWCSNPDD